MNEEIENTEQQEEDVSELVTGGVLVVMLGTSIFVGGTLAVGVLTGIGAAIFSGILLYKTKKYRPKVWNTMMDHPLLTDMGMSTFFVLTIGSMTATGLIAGITAAGVTTVGIDLATKYIGKDEHADSYNFKIKFLNKKRITNKTCAINA